MEQMEQEQMEQMKQKKEKMYYIIKDFDETIEDLLIEIDRQIELNDKKWFSYFKSFISVSEQKTSVTKEDLEEDYAEIEKHLNFLDRIKSFIIKFYMLNPDIDHRDAKANYITDILYIYNEVFTKTFSTSIDGNGYYKETMKQIIERYARIAVSDIIKLIDEAPEKIPVNEKKIAGINKTCVDVINWDDAAKLHEMLKDLNYVIFIQPAEYNRPGTPNSVDYKYLALTYPKKFIKNWLKESKKIKYCDTDPDNKFFKEKTPYILSPLDFNCNPAYVKLWEILHIIHSPQRIFYVLPRSPSERPTLKCMEKEASHNIIKIAICDGADCWKWKWDGETCKIDASDEEKLEIQTECNKRDLDDYIERVGRLQKGSKPGKTKELRRSRTSPYN